MNMGMRSPAYVYATAPAAPNSAQASDASRVDHVVAPIIVSVDYNPLLVRGLDVRVTAQRLLRRAS